MPSISGSPLIQTQDSIGSAVVFANQILQFTGAGVSIAGVGNKSVITIPGGAGAGVDSLNGLTGVVNLVAGTGVSLTVGAGTITIDVTGSGGWDLTGNNLVGGEFIGSLNNQDWTMVRNNGSHITFQYLRTYFHDSIVVQFSAAEVHKTLMVNTNYLLSAQYDRTLWVDTTSSPIIVTMPPGEEGLEFIVKDVNGNAGTNNITFVPDGAETMEVNSDITTNYGSRHFQFRQTGVGTGVWQIIANA